MKDKITYFIMLFSHWVNVISGLLLSCTSVCKRYMLSAVTLDHASGVNQRSHQGLKGSIVMTLTPDLFRIKPPHRSCAVSTSASTIPSG